MDARPREPANQQELDAKLEEHRASDVAAEAAAAEAAPVAGPVPEYDPARYERTLKRVSTPLLLGLSIAIGKLWKPALGGALADAVDGAAQELATQLAQLLGGRFAVTLGFVAIAGAWAEEALRQEAAKLNEPAKRPDNVRPIGDAIATESA